MPDFELQDACRLRGAAVGVWRTALLFAVRPADANAVTGVCEEAGMHVQKWEMEALCDVSSRRISRSAASVPRTQRRANTRRYRFAACARSRQDTSPCKRSTRDKHEQDAYSGQTSHEYAGRTARAASSGSRQTRQSASTRARHRHATTQRSTTRSHAIRTQSERVPDAVLGVDALQHRPHAHAPLVLCARQRGDEANSNRA
jgi:hypothetical protein